MARQTLDEQIQYVLDTSKGNLADVIIQFGDGNDGFNEAIEAAVNTIKSRALSVSPRDLLPVEASRYEARESVSSKREFRQASSSLAAQIALSAMSDVPELRAVGAILRTVASSTLVKNIVDDALRSWNRKADMPRPRTFERSQSLSFMVRKTQLSDFVRDAGNVVGVYPNRRLPLPRFAKSASANEPSGATSVATWGLKKIDALGAWGAFGARGQGTVVAVLDTGVDASHPVLDGRIAHWAQFDREGDPVAGDPNDSDIHGTHVCGTIVGGLSDDRHIGVAPDARLAVARVLDGESGGTDKQILAGIDWAIDQKVDIINMSLGGISFSPFVNDLYTRSILSAVLVGIPVVIAIGNDGDQTTGLPGSDFFSLAVGATDPDDRAAGFSGGRTQVVTESSQIEERHLPLVYSKPDVCAPGVDVLSCVPKKRMELLSGTSMATPHVAGALACCLSVSTLRRDRNPVPQRAFILQDLLTGSVDELGERGQDHRFGFGRIDILRALEEGRSRGYM